MASQTSWGLFLEYLAHPHGGFWGRISYLYALALPELLRPVALGKAAGVVGTLAHDSVAEPTMPEAGPHDGVGALWQAEQCLAVVLASQAGIKSRSGSGVFLVWRFDDDDGVLDPDFARHWRGFLRLLNRLQFLPHAHVITSRAVKAGAIAGLVDAFQHFLAGGGASPTSANEPSVAAVLPPELALADSRVRQFLEQLAAAQKVWPTIGFELEADGRVVATAEAAWPESMCALVSAEAPLDRDTFREAGWTVFEFGPAGLAAEDSNALLSTLPAST
jgi:DEAD/DEAH box helicase domain-containing protein